MRKMTQEALKKLDGLLDVMKRSDWWVLEVDDVECNPHDFSDGDIAVVRDTLGKLPAAEKCLARGGMVRDADGRWCSHGDRVRFRRGRNVEDTPEDWERGELYYDDSDCMWYILDDERGGGAWFRLGSAWEEICQWVYEGDKK